MVDFIPTRSIALGALCAFVLFFPACSCSDEVEENDENYNYTDPIPCSTHEDCDEEDYRCILQEPGEEGECLPLFETRELGEECSQSRHCESGLCYEGVCAEPCQEAGDCPDDMICGESGVCEDSVPCDTDADCMAGTVCAVTASDDGGLETVCMPDNEAGQAGDACEAHDECRSHYCLDGMCTATCEDDDRCDILQVCEEATISKDGEDGEFELCVERPPVDCLSPGDCDLDQMTCNTVVPETGSVEGAVCGLMNLGGADMGEMCTASDDCETDLCWVSDDGTAGECTVFCEDAAEDCADGQVCTVKAAGLGMCLSTCETNADCDGGNVCQLSNDPDFQSVHSYCSLQHGDGQTGDACSESSDCETGLCHEIVTYAVTETECQSNNQCDDGYECRCAPEDPDCEQEVCVAEEGTVQNLCTELCDAENDNADCEDGGHDMVWCNDAVSVEVGGISETIAACSLELEE